MKFKVIKTSDWRDDQKTTIEISTLEEFIEWCKGQDHEIIICDDTLEIYDDDRE